MRMSSLAAALVLLSISLFPGVVALRARTPPEQHQQACAREPPAFLPSIRHNSEPLALRKERSDAELEAYIQNLSHVRVCSTSQDHVGELSALVVPKLKLAFCYIPKVACSNFKDLFNNLNGLPKHLEGYGHDYLTSSRATLRIPEENISKANGWKFATFTRDPALRYLSAFGSTCMPINRLGFFEHMFGCCGPRIWSNRAPRSHVVRAFHERVLSDLRQGTAKMDDHWAQQVVILRQCGWENFKPENLDFLGTLNGDVNAQVKSMLGMVNYTDDALVDRLFPEERIAGHKSPIHMPPEEFYNNITILQAVKQLYEDDYKNLPNVGCSFTDPAVSNLTSQM